MGAGLGGGSADGAFALKLMNNLFDLHLDDYFLEEYAAQLGSDWSIFYREYAKKIARGRGEILNPANISLAGSYLVLINPGNSHRHQRGLFRRPPCCTKSED